MVLETEITYKCIELVACFMIDSQCFHWILLICILSVSCVGGGPVIDIFSRSVQDKKADSHKGRIEELETRVASLEKELSSKRIAQQLKIQRVITESESQDESNFNANMNEKPEDVLKIFMMQQYVGKNLFDNLIIPTGVGSEKKEKVVSNIQGHQCE